MDARSACSIYVYKKAHSVQSEMYKPIHYSKLSKSYFGKKTIVLQLLNLETIIEKVLGMQLRYIIKYILSFSKKPTYGSKVVTFENLLRLMLGEVLQIQHLKDCFSRLFICLSGTVYFTYFYLIRAFILLPVKMSLHSSTKEIDQL